MTQFLKAAFVAFLVMRSGAAPSLAQCDEGPPPPPPQGDKPTT